MDNDTIRNVALIEELENSVRLLKIGFGEYQNLDLANDFYYLPFQLISSGLERLMKCYICLGHLEKNNCFPNPELFKSNLRHDLEKLKNHIITNYFKAQNSKELKKDLEYIKNDKDIVRIIKYLSEFGKFARYYNLNLVTGEISPGIDVKAEWQAYEMEVVKQDRELFKKLCNIQTTEEVLDKITRFIIIKLERFIRALSRQFTIGGLGEKAKQYSSIVYPFLTLMDEDLGKTNYRIGTTTSLNKEYKPYKRTTLDEEQRISNNNYKSKKIRKGEFDGLWPFYFDEVIIECRESHWCVITIKGYDYALNGAAKGRYKLEDVHDAGMAIQGLSVGPFIEMAQNL